MGEVAIIGGDAAHAAMLGAVAIDPADIAHARPALLLVVADTLAALPPSDGPILVLDAPDDPRARAALLDGGAADLVGRDADPIEVRARIRAALRRNTPLRCADLAIDLSARRATRGDRAIALHPREFEVLVHLARHRDHPVTRHALYSAVWHRDFDPGTNVVAVAVSRLRAKVDGGRCRLIHTVAQGYMLSAVAGG